MKTVLIDLDGTLLPIDMNEFLQEYLRLIGRYCSSLAEPQVFVKKLLDATGMMLRNNGGQTNEEVFMEHFLSALGKKREEVYPLLESFYTIEFPKLQKCVKKAASSRLVVEELAKRGWQLVLATNPLFPRQAIVERMRWAGVEDYPWLHISSYENSRSCKPNPLYYQEIIERLGLEPESCWMIGNDMEEDLVAATLGMKTYLVTDFLIQRDNVPYVPHGQGTLEDFLSFVRKEF